LLQLKSIQPGWVVKQCLSLTYPISSVTTPKGLQIAEFLLSSTNGGKMSEPVTPATRNTRNTPESPPKPKAGGWSKVLIGVLALLIGVIAGAAGFYLIALTPRSNLEHDIEAKTAEIESLQVQLDSLKGTIEQTSKLSPPWKRPFIHPDGRRAYPCGGSFAYP
jgi:hypothetical protein